MVRSNNRSYHVLFSFLMLIIKIRRQYGQKGNRYWKRIKNKSLSYHCCIMNQPEMFWIFLKKKSLFCLWIWSESKVPCSQLIYIHSISLQSLGQISSLPWFIHTAGKLGLSVSPSSNGPLMLCLGFPHNSGRLGSTVDLLERSKPMLCHFLWPSPGLSECHFPLFHRLGTRVGSIPHASQRPIFKRPELVAKNKSYIKASLEKDGGGHSKSAFSPSWQT